jgi:SpoIVB peptidase S55
VGRVPRTLRAGVGCAVMMTAAIGLGQAARPHASLNAETSVATALPPRAPKETKIFPLSEVRRGQWGVAYTVFEGVTPEPMQVEILGVLKNALGPGQDMILARLHGTKPEYTGVVAGMSGSPVYIDGRLAGALSYRIGQFSKEPIAGITPIESMFQVKDGDATPSDERTPVTATDSNLTPMETPLVFSGGFSQETVDRFGDRFRALGLTPVAGLGGSDSTEKQPEPLVPGSAVSAVLVRGDLSMAGTCTVTYVDATHLLACGHPITQFGQVSMPMTKADVVATLASPLNAFKIINTTETVGAFTEDRASAIMGRFGKQARMIPVTVEVKGTPQAEENPKSVLRTVHFEVLDNRSLTPSTMLVSVYQSLQQANGTSAEMSYRMSGELTMQGLPTVKLDGIMAPDGPNSAAIDTALYINDRFGDIYANEDEQPIVTGMRLKMEVMPDRHTAVLEQARLSQTEVHPGDTILVEATVHPFQSGIEVVRVPVTIPTGTMPGELRLVVSDGSTVDRMTLPTPSKAVAEQHAIRLRDMIEQMNHMHANDRIYVTLLDQKPQAVLEGGTMGAVPLSMANVLEPLKAEQKMQLTGETAVELGSEATNYAVTGSQVLSIRVH